MNVRNYKMLVGLFLLTITNLVYHLAILSILPYALTQAATIAALDIITTLMAVVGDRVIPLFNANAVRGVRVRQPPMLERTAILSLVLIFATGVLYLLVYVSRLGMAGVTGDSGADAHNALGLWQPRSTLRNPLLLVLRVAYL